jgi:hypothetical protein
VDLVLARFGEWPEPWLMIFNKHDDSKIVNNLQEHIARRVLLVTIQHVDTDAMVDLENVIESPGLN